LTRVEFGAGFGFERIRRSQEWGVGEKFGSDSKMQARRHQEKEDACERRRDRFIRNRITRERVLGWESRESFRETKGETDPFKNSQKD